MSRPGAPGFRPRFFVQRTAAGAASAGAPPNDDLIGAELALGSQDSRHARTVLRLELGDACEVVVADATGAAPGVATDGAVPQAAVYAATVSAVGDPVKVRVHERLRDDLAGATYRVQVGLVQALARPAVMDYIFEKGTEVGASFFVLVSAEGSPKWAAASAADRLDRWNRIVREGAKQSKQVSVPAVVFAGAVGRGLDHVAAAGALSLVLQPGASSSLESVLGDPAVRQSVTGPVALWIGPEGGWTDGEAAQFELAGTSPVRLGKSVLRTETAGPVALAVTRLLLGDW
jgi:16S rRNA (uracil1498-N3)-methyltransferase